MWLFAVLAVPFVLYGADVLLRQRFVGQVLDLIHPDGEIPSIETRDIAWAWVFVIAGGALAAWGLKELILPRKVLEAGERGLSLRVGGPFSQAVVIPWSVIRSIKATRASDDGDIFPVVTFEFVPGQVPRGLPAQPWGARWVSRNTLAVSAQDWDRSAGRAVEDIEATRPKVLSGRARYRPDPVEEMLYEPFPVRPLDDDSVATSSLPESVPEAGSERGSRPEPASDEEANAPKPETAEPAAPTPNDDTAEDMEPGPDGVDDSASTPSRRRPLEPVEPPTPPPHVVIRAAASNSEQDSDAARAGADDGTAGRRTVPVWGEVEPEEFEAAGGPAGDPDLPKSRFTTSHWIILEAEDDDPHSVG